MYRVIDRQTKLFTKGLYKTFRSAKRAADRLDNAYGAYRYYVVFPFSTKIGV
jgi:hypothetical protein